MKRIGFPKPSMKEEKRIALFPEDIAVISQPEFISFQEGYGIDCGFSDDDYRKTGAFVVDKRTAYRLDVVCQPKYVKEDLPYLLDEQTIFGWLHLTPDEKITKRFIRKRITAIDWSFMKIKGESVFYRNGVLTGQIAALHAMPYAAKIPGECRVALIGRGRVGKGCMNTLKKLGVIHIDVYHSENINDLKPIIGDYDVIFHAACSFSLEILSAQDIRNLKKNALFVHLGSDSIRGMDNISPQSIYSPIVEINRGRNLVYCVNHVPTLAYQTASRYISQDVAVFLDCLISEEWNSVLQNAVVIDKGRSSHESLSLD